MMMRQALLLALPGLVLGAGPGVSAASGWHCRNPDLEVTCPDTGACSATDSFTPLGVSVDATELGVCAYTGCWQGPARITEDERLLYAQGRDLAWSHAENAAPGTFQLALDKITGIGVLNGEGFAMPVRCEAGG